jgi:hypothetical protein
VGEAVTQHRNDPTRRSNWFDRALDGIGHRGSSFCDVDALTHDDMTDRFLFQEFKNAGETMQAGQSKLLKGLARQDWVTVWSVRRRHDSGVDWYDVARGGPIEAITVEEYRARFARWWANQPVVVDAPTRRVLPTPPELPPEPPSVPREPAVALTAADIPWKGRS